MHEASIKAINTADSLGRYINATELDALKGFAAIGQQRIEILSCITENVSKIVTNAARILFDEEPHLIAPDGNAYTNRRMAACLRDMEYILRYITYAFLSADTSILDDRCLNGLRETYLALGVPTSSVANAIQKMKKVTLESLSLQTSQNQLEERTILEIRKFYPKQWVTMEVTKSEDGFPVRGKVIHHDHDITKLSDRTSQLSGDKIYTFFTSKIDEKPEPLTLVGTNSAKIVVTSEHQYLLTELAFYFDRSVDSIA